MLFDNSKYNLVLVPYYASIPDVEKEFNNIDNYGIYIPNMINYQKDITNKISDYFGPSNPILKKKIEKERQKHFPIKTRENMNKFIKSLDIKPHLINWVVADNKMIFPKNRNPNFQATENIIKTVMKNAGIIYDLEYQDT